METKVEDMKIADIVQYDFGKPLSRVLEDYNRNEALAQRAGYDMSNIGVEIHINKMREKFLKQLSEQAYWSQAIGSAALTGGNWDMLHNRLDQFIECAYLGKHEDKYKGRWTPMREKLTPFIEIPFGQQPDPRNGMWAATAATAVGTGVAATILPFYYIWVSVPVGGLIGAAVGNRGHRRYVASLEEAAQDMRSQATAIKRSLDTGGLDIIDQHKRLREAKQSHAEQK